MGTAIKYLRGAAGISLGTTNRFLRQTTSAAASNSLGTTINYLSGAVSIGLGTTIKYLRRTTNAATGNGRGRRPGYCDSQRALPRAAAWAPR
jgi:hypothetical protein